MKEKKDYSFTRIPSEIFPAGVFELAVTYKRKKEKRLKIQRSADAADFARRFMYPDGSIEYVELFYIILCDRANQAFAFKKISEGGTAGTVVDPKIIFQIALLCHASHLVLVHQHPSGNKKPSEADISLTRKIVEGGRLLEITILDHLILTADDHFSFSDEGLL